MTRNATVGEGSVLSKELRLSNGVTLSNRIAQSAMTEHLATGDGAPSWQLIEAYKRFAVSGAALIISGNVMVNGWSLEAPGNVVIEDEWHLPQLRHIRVVPRDCLARRLELRPATAPHHGSGRPTELRSACRAALNHGRIRARVAALRM